MSMIDISYAVLHNSLFLNGKNFGLTLDSGKNTVKLKYDLKEKELLVTWVAKPDQTAHIPHSNVAYYIPGKPVDRKLEQVASPMTLGVSATAQVETPMSHVHAGTGHGKTGQKGK